MKNIYYSILSGFFLGIAFAVPQLFFLIFFAFIPLLIIEKENLNRPNKYLIFNYAFISFLIWNTIACWWIGSAHLLGAVLIIICNALVQALVFWAASRTRRTLNKPLLFSWIIIWLGFEYFHSNWDLAWPWLNLGNVFAAAPKIIQWYEFTGSRGGTLWVIIINYLFFHLLIQKQNRAAESLLLFLAASAPLSLSLYLYQTPPAASGSRSFAIIQPNIDPYTEKFKPENQQIHYHKLLKTIDSLCINSQSDFLIIPETSILSFIDEQNPGTSSEYRQLKQIIEKYPQTEIIIGTHSTCCNKKYNSAMLLTAENTQFYHKHWLVPLFEQVPFQRFLKFMPSSTITLGGFQEAYSRDNKTAFFKTGSTAVTPIVCYESIFGAYCSQRIPRQAGFTALITNDGWWKNTPGYFYHFNFSRLRAIESRREIIRSANNGISAHISSKGEIIKKTCWQQQAVLQGELNCMPHKTYYAKNGDYLGRISLFFSIFVLFYVMIKSKIIQR